MLRIEGLTDDQLRAYRLADNRLAELAGWDQSMIEIEVQHLSTVDFGFTIETIGWDMPEIDVILAGTTASVEAAGASPDAADEQPVIGGPAISREGDIWVLDRHRLACGSSLDPDVLTRLMAGKRARHLLQDPPWNIPTTGFISTTSRHREFAMAAGEMTEDGFVRPVWQAQRRPASGRQRAANPEPSCLAPSGALTRRLRSSGWSC